MVIILGCGPAALLSAYACDQLGHQVLIYSKKVKSRIPGAVFLHEPIPRLTAPTPDGWVNFIKHGNRYAYAQKVYGNQDADCSWDLFPEGERPAWSMFDLYDWLWYRYNARIVEDTLDAERVRYIQHMADLVISTIPVMSICENPKHRFYSQDIFILNKAVDRSLKNTIVYNGSPMDTWYRSSSIFGHEATESVATFDPELVKQLGAKVSKGFKPIKTNCNCHPNVARVGRFGRWEKGILVHHAYKQTIQILGER